MHRLCPVCRGPLNWRQKTCSARCRKAYQRQGQNLKKSAGAIISELNAIAEIIKHRPDLAAPANELLRDIETRVRDTLKLRPDDDMKALQQMLYERSRRQL